MKSKKRVINPELLRTCYKCGEKKQYGRIFPYQHCSMDDVHERFECAQCQEAREAREKDQPTFDIGAKAVKFSLLFSYVCTKTLINKETFASSTCPDRDEPWCDSCTKNKQMAERNGVPTAGRIHYNGRSLLKALYDSHPKKEST